MNVLFGISNCDAVRKTGQWLTQQQAPWQLHDYRKNGLDENLLQQLMSAFALTVLVNRRGTTYKQLDTHEQTSLDAQKSATTVLLAHPALIKRPILRTSNGTWLLGYDEIVASLSKR
jgi:Spx/MgsR family transcriptional regulator